MAGILTFILNAIKLVIISILSLFYFPLNMFFLWFQKHYRSWKLTDRTSYRIATPLYYLLFFLTAAISTPLEIMGEAFHPPLDGFR
jgi:drug/metabolite transporter (DMT)-like permease